MKWFFVLLLFLPVAVAQTSQFRSGAAVYIEPMSGYETYLAAAFIKEHVPLAVITDRDKADYIIRGTISQNVPQSPQMVINNSATATVNGGESGNQAWNEGWASGQAAAERRAARRASLGSTSVSISMIDVHSSQIVFASSAAKGGTTDQEAKTAEKCAKDLRQFIEKAEKQKK